MAINLEGIDQWEKWYPVSYGQRELAKTDREGAASVEIKFLSRKERKQLNRLTILASLDRVDHEESDKVLRGFFETHVRNVRNMTSGNKPITTGEQLLDLEDDNLAAEITSALTDRSTLEAGLAKKLLSPSDSKSLGPKPSAGGDAPVVIPASPEAIPVEPEKTEI